MDGFTDARHGYINSKGAFVCHGKTEPSMLRSYGERTDSLPLTYLL